MSVLVPRERIEQTILLLRSHKVILDRDLAAMYGVSTRDLNKAVSRNTDRFPDDFMLQLTRAEFNDLKFQFGTSNGVGRGNCQKPLRKVGGHDGQIRSLFDAIRQLMEPPPVKSRRIGFKAGM